MKRPLKLLMMAGMLALALISCKKEDDVPAVTADDASDLVSNSMMRSQFGIASQMEQSAVFFEPCLSPAWCGIANDSTFLKYYGGMEIQFNYTFNWSWTVTCNGGTVNGVNVDYNSTGNNASSLLSSTFTTTGDFTVTGVEGAASEYIFNGTYTRNGNMTSKVREQHAFDYELSMIFSQLKVDKTTYLVESGTASVTLHATTSEAEDFNFGGTVTVGNGQNCTLVIGEDSFTFQL